MCARVVRHRYASAARNVTVARAVTVGCLAPHSWVRAWKAGLSGVQDQMLRILSPLPRMLLHALFCLLLVSPSHGVAGASSPDWSQIIDQAVPAVVQLRVNATRDFYMEDASTPVATGFVVDAERGLVLTNRHVVTAGPVRAKAIFVNNEEVAVEAVYRDPVHDFGLFRFDPSDLRFQELTALQLDAEAAEVGMEVWRCVEMR